MKNCKWVGPLERFCQNIKNLLLKSEKKMKLIFSKEKFKALETLKIKVFYFFI